MATYYIDPTGINDAGRNGGVGQEWATLAYACSRVTTSGNIIHVNAGTYNESSQIVKAIGVSITGTGDTSHIISTYTSGSSLQAAIQCASTAGITTNDNSSISYIRLTGSNLTSTRAIFVGYRNNLHIHHCRIEDFLYMGVYFYVSASYPTVYATGLKLYNCVINNCASYGGGYQGNVRLSGTDRTEIYDCSFDNTFRPTGYNAHIFSTYRNKRLKIHDNVLIKNNHETTAEGVDTWNFFLEEWNYKGDSEFYNNTLYGLAKFSLGGDENDIEDGCTFGYKVYNNKWLNNANGNRINNGDDSTAYCLTVEGNNHNEVYVYDNLIQRFAWGLEIATPTSSTGGTWSQNWSNQNIYFYRNTITDIGYLDHTYSYGIMIINEPNQNGYTNSLLNVHIYNNIITALNGSTYDGYQGIRVVSNGVLTGLNINNNIIKDFSNYGIYVTENSPDLVLTNADITHNCMYNNGTDSVYISGSVTQVNIDKLTGNIAMNPLFLSASDFRLQSTSPCINAGVDVGLPYKGTAPDIGAYEYIIGVIRNTISISPTDLKLYSSYPKQEDIVVGSNGIECRNLGISKLRQVLRGANSKLFSLGNLTGTFIAGGENGKVNAWARYKAGQTAYDEPLPTNCDDNPTFTYTAPGSPPGVAIGVDFAGYNHHEDTKPVYWSSPPSGGEYIEGISVPIKGGLSRGKLCPILSWSPEDETYWSRVKVQSWIKSGGGSYSLVGTSAYVDLSEPSGEDATTIYTIGAHSESTGITYTVCLRPIYMDTDDVTPLAVCEGGIVTFDYTLTALGEYLLELGFTVTDVATTSHNEGTRTVLDYDFTIDNPQTYSIECDVRLVAIEAGGGEWEQGITLGTFTVPSGSLAFTNSWQLTQLVDAGTFNLDVRVKAAGTSNWYTLGRVASGLVNWGL